MCDTWQENAVAHWGAAIVPLAWMHLIYPQLFALCVEPSLARGQLNDWSQRRCSEEDETPENIVSA